MQAVDYSQVGLRVGLEIHRQLDSSHKLFCKCPTQLSETPPTKKILRRLRPTQSELGQVDPAALFEFQKGKLILYELDDESTCLVEADEEPPRRLNPEVIEIALTIGGLLKSRPIDELHVMRKLVIDGSNTTGFQRTCVVALGGEIQANGKKIPVQHISIEEDAARKTGDQGDTVNYRLDRLGIPLIEIATAPVIESPEEAEKVAAQIGKILKATRKVKRGLGTIRQDLNISIKDGALIEIKGAQELGTLSKIVAFEVQRQLAILKIRGILTQRQVKETDLETSQSDLTDLFKKTQSKVIRKALEKHRKVKGVKLKGFAGLLKTELIPNLRLGTEMAHRAAFWGRVGGIFHTDELPAYGICQEETELVRKRLSLELEDAGVFVADTSENATDALNAVLERAKEALRGVPEETRAPNEDGTTRYMRPRPGAARMYPETDVPPTVITEETIQRILGSLPPMPEQLIQQLEQKYQLNPKLAEKIAGSEYLTLFEKLCAATKIQPTFIATSLTENMTSLQRDGVPVETLSDNHIEETFLLVNAGSTAKESIPSILGWLAKNPSRRPADALTALGLVMMTREQLDKIVDKCIIENKNLVAQLDVRNMGKLIGIVMKEVRGKADAQVVTELIKSRLKKK